MDFVMDRPLVNLIYVCTFRCNYKCKMCFQNSARHKKYDELSFEQFIDIIKNSKYLSNLKTIEVNGGEIFLKEGAVDFLLKLEELGLRIIITSNGYFTDEIIELLKKIKNVSSIFFAISLDGLEETHNTIRGSKNAYQCAINTIKIIKERGANLQVNTVMQAANMDDFEKLQEIVSSMGISHCWIPLGNDIVNPPFFTNQQVLKQFSYAQTEHDKKYILSKGNYVIKNCHAGIQSCYINPSGDVYCCYLGESHSEFFLGSLKKDPFDMIWTSERVKSVYNNSISCCKGCYFGCEAFREVNVYNLSAEIFKDEIFTVKSMLKDYIDWSFESPGEWGWHNREKDDQNCLFRWMARSESKVFLRRKSDNLIKALEFKYMNLLSDDKIKLSVIINDKTIEAISCNNGTHSLLLPQECSNYQTDEIIEVKFKVDHLWLPSDYGSLDSRLLGIAIFYIKLIYA